MSIKSFLAKPFAKYEVNKNKKSIEAPIAAQEKILKQLVAKAQYTDYGKEHQFENINSYEDFKKNVPINDYEGLKKYIEQIKNGQSDVLWPGKPKYFAKTSGTTSGVKYIPISDISIKNQVKAARLALQYFIYETKQTKWVDGKMIFLQGSPAMESIAGIPTGRLSGITYHEVPAYLLKNRKPTYATNCIEDWESKVEAIVEETIYEDMTLISGIAPWVIMYFEKLLEKSGKKTIKEVFPNLTLYVHGGVNFQPYKATFKSLIGADIAYIETFPASEGFVAIQNTQQNDDLLLITDGGIFYEFIPANEIFNENPTRIMLDEVELDVNYALILNTDAGLWGYNIGDTVKFTSLNPYKIRVSGRTKHFISAFGEHVIGEEVESAIVLATKDSGTKVREFTVAPMINVADGYLPYHEWLIDFEVAPNNMNEFEKKLDTIMRNKNIYYDDLITGKILSPLKITSLKENAFRNYMEKIGKLGGQNKIPRLSNDRKIASILYEYKK